jgi:hypothetical protein
MDVHRYLLEEAEHYRDFYHDAASEYPDEHREEIGNLGARWFALLQQEKPSVEDTERLLADIERLIENNAHSGAKRLRHYVSVWLNELKGGETYDPVTEHSDLLSRDKDNTALAKTPGGYAIIQINNEGQHMGVIIEDDELYREAIV